MRMSDSRKISPFNHQTSRVMDRYNALTEWEEQFGTISEKVALKLKYMHVFGCAYASTMGAFMITEDDDVYAVGYNGQFRLLCAPRDVAIVKPEARIRSLSGLKLERISVGRYVGAALTEDGRIYCWGRNLIGLRTPATVCEGPAEPLRSCARRFTKIECGSEFVAALTTSSTVMIWGFIHPSSMNACAYSVSTSILSFDCGLYHISMLTLAGDVFTCGHASWGELGRVWYPSEGFLTARPVDLGGRCVQVACGKHSTLFLMANGSLFASGVSDCTSGYLGCQGWDYEYYYPERVQINEPVVEIAASFTASSSYYGAVTNRGLVFEWGENEFPTKVHDQTLLASAFYGVAIPSSLGDVCLCENCRASTANMYPEY